MATLTRPKNTSQTAHTLSSNIPTPFPRERLLRAELLQALSTDDFQPNPAQAEAGPSRIVKQDEQQAEADVDLSSSDSGAHELLPSITYVQNSCLMTLNNLLSGPSKWHPILPDRRHSMPSSPQSSMNAQPDSVRPSSALHTLVSNLRSRDTGEVMVEAHLSGSDTELISELRARVEDLSYSLESNDAQLALSLVSLLSHFHRLSTVQSTSSARRRPIMRAQALTAEDAIPHVNMFDTLKRQLSDLQIERLSSQTDGIEPGSHPALAVETALLWSRIDEDLDRVVSMCKERTECLPRFPMASDHLPPQYDASDYHFDTPPEYEYGGRSSIDDSKTRHGHSPSATTNVNEKMRLDLEAVTMAIDRLYMVAPQLHNQRVELKSTKLEQMEKARRAGGQQSSSTSSSRSAIVPGQQTESDVRELENIMILLDKASERKLSSQSVTIQGGMETRLEKARLRDIAKRDAFVEHLVQHSDAGRFHGQDAILHPRIKDPEALLSLPEFIRESVPNSVRTENPRALLTLPEFVKELPPPHIIHAQVPTVSRLKSQSKSHRHRSMSAPTLSWLRPRSAGLTAETRLQSSSSAPESQVNFEVSYIAEYHENLHHILVFLMVTGATPGVDLEAEVLPSSPDSTEAERLIVRSGFHSSLPLLLPARTTAGKKEIRVQSGHYEIKLPTSPTATPSEDPLPLLDASQLSASNPTSFICASCSLPLVQSSLLADYRDLPSEHWEELVDAWMCHTDQTLHDQVAKHGRGFWPSTGQALVGGSYILFEESSMAKINICPADTTKNGEDWRLVRCLCGAVVGRCQEHFVADGVNPTVYRLLKYAIRPVSPTTEPSRVPLSAFIVEDMTEFVQAHATYRFIILDEEEERPRLLIWLFKPSIRIAYMTRRHFAIPRSASMHAAKVLYKIIGPSTVPADIETLVNRYPGFPQAEHLFYPMDICRRLAVLLKESNSSYPESMRIMTGLDVGWLHRA